MRNQKTSKKSEIKSVRGARAGPKAQASRASHRACLKLLCLHRVFSYIGAASGMARGLRPEAEASGPAWGGAHGKGTKSEKSKEIKRSKKIRNQSLAEPKTRGPRSQAERPERHFLRPKGGVKRIEKSRNQSGIGKMGSLVSRGGQRGSG